MKCLYRSKLSHEEGKRIREYRKRMFRESRERRMFESTVQRVCDQERAIRKTARLSELQLEAVSQVKDEFQGELYSEQDVTVEVETVETDVRTVKEEINDAEDSIGDTEDELSEENRMIVE